MKASTAILLMISMVFYSCSDRKIGALSDYNRSTPSTVFQQRDTSGRALWKSYGFEIFHEKEASLAAFHMVINIDDKTVYSDIYRQKVQVDFYKNTDLNSFAVILYDTIRKVSYVWTN